MRRYAAVALAGLVAAGVVVAAVLLAAGGEDASATESPPGTTTALAARRDLVRRETVSGTLGYADTRTLGAAREGTYTELPEPGARLRRGRVIYRVNEQPVVLFDGPQPAWRAFESSMSDGEDVLQLERNLRALGHDPDHDMTVDRDFTWATAAAIERWEEDLGVEETGRIQLGEVVFLPGPRRVAQVLASVGGRAGGGGPVMKTSSTMRIVTASIDASRQEETKRGARVTVDLLNGTVTAGRISAVDRVAHATTSGSAVSFEVTLDRPGVAASLDQAPVNVQVVNERATDVLAVPVTALLALQGGGYGVQVVRSGEPQLVGVNPGLYSDDGFIEVTGGLRAGDRVVVPQ